MIVLAKLVIYKQGVCVPWKTFCVCIAVDCDVIWSLVGV